MKRLLVQTCKHETIPVATFVPSRLIQGARDSAPCASALNIGDLRVPSAPHWRYIENAFSIIRSRTNRVGRAGEATLTERDRSRTGTEVNRRHFFF